MTQKSEQYDGDGPEAKQNQWPQHLGETVRHGYQQMQDDPEPRWPAIIALVASVGLFTVLPKYLSFGPRWLPAVIVMALLIPTLLTRLGGLHHYNRVLGLSIAAIETFFMIASLIRLVSSLELHRESPTRLLISAGALWLTNVLVFALWYWHLDAGGPNQRDQQSAHVGGSFLFPQMALTDDKLEQLGQTDWSPGFVDYLFLAFNTSSALSPADTAALSRWAKLLMMTQAIISLTLIAVVAARAINTLS